MLRKTLFIHIPKTAGMSLSHTELVRSSSAKIHPLKGPITEKIEELGAEEFFKFAFVRNPWDRFFSLYNYFHNMDESHQFYKYNHHFLPEVKKFKTFDEFCLAFPTLRLRNNFHFYRQTEYVLDAAGRRVTDFLGRYENLQKDAQRLCRQLELGPPEAIPHKNRSNTLDYREHYTPSGVEVIGKYYESDIQQFGYAFST